LESVHEHIAEEVGLGNTDGVLDEGLTVLLIEEGVENPKIGHILLLGVERIGKGSQALL
jgi:hypothetical protein